MFTMRSTVIIVAVFNQLELIYIALNTDVSQYQIPSTLDEAQTVLLSIYRSIRADIDVIRFEYQTGCIGVIFCLPGTLDLADTGTRTNSHFSQSLQLSMYSAKIAISNTHHESTRIDRSLC